MRVEPGIPFERAAPFLPADPIIIEAGASNGMDLAPILAVWPNATIHAFEPEPYAFQQLSARASELRNVHAWNLALGDCDGTTTLNVSDGVGYGTTASSLLRPATVLNELPMLAFTPTTIEQRTLDSWANENAVDDIGLMALDMQGAEYVALNASRHVLRNTRVVITEAFLQNYYEGVATVDRLQALLAGEGFVITDINLYWNTTYEMLAVRRDILDEAVMTGRFNARARA